MLCWLLLNLFKTGFLVYGAQHEFHSVSFCGFCGVCCMLSALGNSWKKEMCFNLKYSTLLTCLFLSIAVASPERWHSLFLNCFSFQ